MSRSGARVLAATPSRINPRAPCEAMRIGVRNPLHVSCWQVFEPRAQRGRHMESLGFSVLAEPAHRNQGRLPCYEVLGQRVTFNHEHGRGYWSFGIGQTAVCRRIVINGHAWQQVPFGQCGKSFAHPTKPFSRPSPGRRLSPIPGLSCVIEKTVKPFGLFRNAMGHVCQLLPELDVLTAYVKRCLQ